MSKFPDLFNYSSCIMDNMIIIFGGMLGKYCQSKDQFCLLLEDRRIVEEQNNSINFGVDIDDIKY